MSATMPNMQLSQVRTILGWSQQQVADFVGVTKAAVSQWESEKRTPSGPAQRLLDELSKRAEKKSKKVPRQR